MPSYHAPAVKSIGKYPIGFLGTDYHADFELGLIDKKLSGKMKSGQSDRTVTY